MQKNNRANTLFYAANDPRLLMIHPGFLALVSISVSLIQMRRGLISPLDTLFFIGLMIGAALVSRLAMRQQITFASDHLCSTSGFFKKRVRYHNIRSISLLDIGGDFVLLTFELRQNRYSPVRDVAIPRVNCREILRILASQSPQAQWNDLGRQWRDNTTE